MMSAIERLRKQLESPVSLMGGESYVLNIADVRSALCAVDKLRSALRVQFLRTSPEASHEAIDKFLDEICGNTE